jgi:nucleoside 2-deoxyribosyltransferase
MNMLRIYTASMMHHGRMWREICENRSDVIFHARWLKMHKQGHEETPENAAKFWPMNVADIKASDGLIAYAEKDDRLRGALVEVGIALNSNIFVFVIGKHFSYGTWQYHPNVIPANSIPEAIDTLKTIQPY